MINIYTCTLKQTRNYKTVFVVCKKKTWGNQGKNIKVTVNNKTIYSCRKCFKCGGRILSNFYILWKI